MQDEAQIRLVNQATSTTKPCNKMEMMTKHQSTFWSTMSEEDWVWRESGPRTIQHAKIKLTMTKILVACKR